MNRNTPMTTSPCSEELEQEKSMAEEASRRQETRRRSPRGTGESPCRSQVARAAGSDPAGQRGYDPNRGTTSRTAGRGPHRRGQPCREQLPGENDKASEVVKKAKASSDYFHTLDRSSEEPKLIQAIIDEDIKAVDGSRVRLRLLDDVEIDGAPSERAPTCMPRSAAFLRKGERQHQQHPRG